MTGKVRKGVLLLLGATALCYGPTAMAQALPTSENPTTGKWTHMRPSSFAGTIESAREQCDRDAKLDAADRLTPEKCELFEQQLKAGTCPAVLVPDGAGFDMMNAWSPSGSYVTRNVSKALGREDRALHCDVGDEVHLYWFTGKKESCNNVGVTFSRRPPEPAKVETPPQPKTKIVKVCRIQNGPTTYTPGPTISVPGTMFLDNCDRPHYVSPQTIYGSGTSGSSSYEVCQYITVEVTDEAE